MSIFGDKINNYELYLNILSCDNSIIHLLYKQLSSNKLLGYFMLKIHKDKNEIHGGGLNSSFFEKNALSEACILTIQYYFKIYKTALYTSCDLTNVKAKNFISKLGFKEFDYNSNEKKIIYKMLENDFRYCCF